MYATVHTISPFDTSVGTTIYFTWNGNQIYKVRCIIKENNSGIIIYDDIANTMKTEYSFPPNSGLVNGKNYSAYITVFDVDNNESTIQNIGTSFYCYSTPTFSLSISGGDIIRASSYETTLAYSKTESEALNSFEIIVYTYQKTQFQTSGTNYDTSDLSYIMTGLESSTQYYIRAIGETVHGMILDTGYILFTVSYTVAQLYSVLELENVSESGSIRITGNIESILGISESGVIYIDGEYADLRDNSVTYNEGFSVSGNFSKILAFKKPALNNAIIKFGNSSGLEARIYYREGSYSDSDGKKAFFQLCATMGIVNYIRLSNYVDIVPDNSFDYYKYVLLIIREGNNYDLKAVKVSTVIRYSSNSDGSDMTIEKQFGSLYIGICNVPNEADDNYILDPDNYTWTAL